MTSVVLRVLFLWFFFLKFFFNPWFWILFWCCIITAFKNWKATSITWATWRTICFSDSFLGSTLSKRSLKGLYFSNFLHISFSIVFQRIISRMIIWWICWIIWLMSWVFKIWKNISSLYWRCCLLWSIIIVIVCKLLIIYNITHVSWHSLHTVEIRCLSIEAFRIFPICVSPNTLPISFTYLFSF